MKEGPTRELVSEAFLMAIEQRRPTTGLIYHGDPGFQYCTNQYVELLKRHGIMRIMSRKGNCYDNAVVESLFSSLKNELVHHQNYHTKQEARSDIFDYIELCSTTDGASMSRWVITPQRHTTRSNVWLN